MNRRRQKQAGAEPPGLSISGRQSKWGKQLLGILKARRRVAHVTDSPMPPIPHFPAPGLGDTCRHPSHQLSTFAAVEVSPTVPHPAAYIPGTRAALCGRSLESEHVRHRFCSLSCRVRTVPSVQN